MRALSHICSGSREVIFSWVRSCQLGGCRCSCVFHTSININVNMVTVFWDHYISIGNDIWDLVLNNLILTILSVSFFCLFVFPWFWALKSTLAYWKAYQLSLFAGWHYWSERTFHQLSINLFIWNFSMQRFWRSLSFLSALI